MTRGVDDKIGALVGSRTVVAVGTSMARKRIPSRHPRIPRSPVPGGTVVYRQLVSLPPSFGSQPLMAIDTRTFESAADWGSSSGALAGGRGLVPDLRERGPDLPVLLVGDTDREVGDKGIFVSYEEWSARYVVVGPSTPSPARRRSPPTSPSWRRPTRCSASCPVSWTRA